VPVQIQAALIAAMVSSVGWIIGHWLTIRAQKKGLQNQIINSAREAVVRDLRRYANWLSSVITFTMSLSVNVELERKGFPQNWAERTAKALKLFYDGDDTLTWLFTLEEYELAFPETRDVRDFLQQRHKDLLGKELHVIFGGLVDAAIRPVVLTQNHLERFQEQQAAVEYLRVIIQNLSLGKLLDRQQPIPEPTIPGLIKLELRDGMVRVVISDRASAERGRMKQGPVPNL
jgi:hypothetical protein